MRILNLMAVAAATVGLSVPFASANLVIDGDFEAPLGTSSYNPYGPGQPLGDTIDGVWKVTAGSVDLIHGYWVSSGSSQSIDTAGWSSGTLEQTIYTGPGRYHLTFDMAGNPDGGSQIKTLMVTLGGESQTFTFDTRGHSDGDMGWTQISCDFNVTSANPVLIFQDQSGNTVWGAAIDNVSLAAVPEPSTILAGTLMLLPFGLGAVRSLRKARE